MSIVRRTESFIWLDVARAIAAAIVLAGHLRAYVFHDSIDSPHLAPAWKAFYFLTSLQHQAVVVFFVLSGFLISKTISEQANSGKWSWLLYAVKRLSRLWIVLLPALLLTLAWDQAGMHLTGSALYSGALNSVNHSTPVGPLSFSLPTFIGNVFFLQTITVPSFGTDTPLWSLANEFWYYVVFPLFYFAFRRIDRPALRFGYISLAGALCIWLLPAQCLLGLVWLLGYGAYLLHRHVMTHPPSRRLAFALAGTLIFAVTIVTSKTFKLDDSIQDFITGIAFTLFLAPMAGFHAWSSIARPARLFAGFSYTLYVVHFPFLAFATSAFLHNARVAPSFRGLTTYTMLYFAVMLYAFGVSLLFERNTPVIQAVFLAWVRGLSLRTRSTKVALRTE